MGTSKFKLRSSVRVLLSMFALFVLSGSVSAETWLIVDLREGHQQSISVEENLEFSADVIEKRESGHVLHLLGASKVTFGDRTLEAEKMSILPDEHLVIVLDDLIQGSES